MKKISNGVKASILKINLIIIFGLFVCRPAQAAYPVDLYFFYSQTCPVCHEAGIFLGDLVKKYPEIKIKNFEIFTSSENQQAYFAFGQAYSLDLSQTPIPLILIGEKAFNAYTQSIASEIEQTAIKCLSLGCGSPIEKLKSSTEENGENKINKTTIRLLTLVIVVFIFFLVRKPRK